MPTCSSGSSSRGLQEWAPPTGKGRRWVVITPAGGPPERIELPRTLTVFQVGADWILGTWTDDLDEERVGVFAVQGGAAARSIPLAGCSP